MNKKSILVLIERFGPGGAEKAAALLADALQQSGSFNVVYASVYAAPEMYHTASVPMQTLGLLPAQNLFRKLCDYPRKWHRLRRLKRHLGVDLTISLLWPADWINALTGRERKVAVVQIHLQKNPQNRAMLYFRSLSSFIYRRFDRVVAVSSAIENELRALFSLSPQNLVTIPNPIDARELERQQGVQLEPKLQEAFARYRVMLAASRLHPIKNNLALVPLLRQLADTPGLKLAIAGDGEEAQALRAALRREGLRWCEPGAFDATADVYFLGFRADIAALLSRSALFLMPTRGEGFPLALLEALWCRVPVLAANEAGGGVAELLTSSPPEQLSTERPLRTPYGYLLPVPEIESHSSIEQWATCARELLSLSADDRERQGKAARERAMNFDIPGYQRAWILCINELLPS